MIGLLIIILCVGVVLWLSVLDQWLNALDQKITTLQRQVEQLEQRERNP